MRSRPLPALCLWAAFLLLLAAGTPASAAPKRITGKLTKPGYTLIALAETGEARVVRVRRGRFAVRPPARAVTLQLRNRKGIYAGPVVAGRRERGTRAIVGVRAGANLGRVKVRRKYARVLKRLGDRALIEDVVVRARRGVPIGAGRFGRVRSRGARPLPGDRDRDGIPDVLDVDDDGDLVLDEVDRASAGAGAAQDEERFDFHTRLTLTIDKTANANATGLSESQIDEAVSTSSDLLFTVMPGDDLPNSPELDCGGEIQEPPRPLGLVYCRPHETGGVGTLLNSTPFPDCCDLDEDGLGKLTADTGPVGTPLTAMTLRHHATTAQIKTGDLMIQRVLRNGVEEAFLGAIQYIFASVPAAKAYRGETGPTHEVPYPYPAATDPDGSGPLRIIAPPIQVADGPDAGDDVEVTFTFWRPQRSPVAQWGETDWIDLGRLRYDVQVEFSGLRCPQNAFSTNDDGIALHSSPDLNPGFSDLADDAPANPANTFTFTLNLSRCLEPNGFSFEPGDTRGFIFVASNRNSADGAEQAIWFQRQP